MRRKNTEWLCRCGSKLYRYPLFDARGIFCAYVCKVCEKKKKSEFRAEIFIDPNYYADEDIEEQP